MNEIKIINQIIKKVTKKNLKISLTKNLFKSGIDSLDLTTIFLTIEDQFKIKFKKNSYEKLNTLKNLSTEIKKLKKQ